MRPSELSGLLWRRDRLSLLRSSSRGGSSIADPPLLLGRQLIPDDLSLLPATLQRVFVSAGVSVLRLVFLQDASLKWKCWLQGTGMLHSIDFVKP